METPEGDLVYVSNEEVVRLTAEKPVVTNLARYDLGQIYCLSVGENELFVSGLNGMVRIRGDRIDRIDWRRAPWIARMRDMIQTPAGDTWMLRQDSVARVKTDDLERAFDDPRTNPERKVFDYRDGFAISQGIGTHGPQLAVGGDGRIWFLSKTGVTSIDPATIPQAEPPPLVVVRSLTAREETIRDPSQLTIAAGTRSIDISYTALRAADPRRVAFRYRLIGLDDAWTDAGDRRDASFNLGPGRYRFEVIASSNHGPWGRAGPGVNFDIRPTFIQSWPFKVLCGLLLVGIFWLAFSLRLRIVAGRIRLLMSERHEERERIARELHDTLLQGFQALLLRFQAATNRLPGDEPARLELNQALDRAEAF